MASQPDTLTRLAVACSVMRAGIKKQWIARLTSHPNNMRWGIEEF